MIDDLSCGSGVENMICTFILTLLEQSILVNIIYVLIMSEHSLTIHQDHDAAEMGSVQVALGVGKENMWSG